MGEYSFKNKDGTFEHKNFATWQAAWVAAVTAAHERNEQIWVSGPSSLTVRYNPNAVKTPQVT